VSQSRQPVSASPTPCNKGKLVGQKAPLKLKELWGIRIRLQLAERTRDLALFDLAIDSKLRACDLLKLLRVSDVAPGGHVATRAIVMQQKTKPSVRFEITESTREAVAAWILKAGLAPKDFLFPAGCIAHLIFCRHGNMPVWSSDGSASSA
jgi:hypothetical protein